MRRSRTRERLRSSSRDERGAIIPMMAMLLVVLIPSTAIAVDLGMQRVVRRDLQALADVVALDLVRLVDGRTAAQIHSGYNGHPTLAAAQAKSVDRNADVLGDLPTVTVTLAFMDPTTHRLETVVDPNGQAQTREATGSEVPTALEVRAEGGIEFAFAPGRGSAARVAVAVPSPSTCFRLGSYAVGVDLDDSNLLNALMPELINNSTFSSTLVGYQGLAAADIDLLDLVGVSSLGVASPDELLELGGLTLGQFYAAMASALQANGGDTASVALLQTLSTKANLTSHVAVRDMLDIESGNTAALAASFNVLDLVVGAAYAANGTNSLSVPGLATQVPGLTGMTASLLVGDKPKLACGGVGARARTGQADLTLSGNLADVSSSLTGPSSLTANLGPLGGVVGGLLTGITSGVVTGGPITATTYVESEVHLAQAEGLLTRIVCGDATSAANAEGIDVAVSASVMSSMSTQQTVAINGTLNLRITTLLGLEVNIATITIDLSSIQTSSTTQGTATSTVSFRHPDDDYGTPKSMGSGIVLNNLAAPTVSSSAQVHVDFNPGYGVDGDVDVSAISGLNGVLNALLATATGNVNAMVVSPLNTLVTPQLQRQVGVRVGGADLFALPRPSCNDPALAG
ncbi:pilus assembly protein TadG-related protein [Nocardioides dilutus]